MNELKNRLSSQKGISVQFDQIPERNHFFQSQKKPKKSLNNYISKESALF